MLLSVCCCECYESVVFDPLHGIGSMDSTPVDHWEFEVGSWIQMIALHY